MHEPGTLRSHLNLDGEGAGSRIGRGCLIADTAAELHSWPCIEGDLGRITQANPNDVAVCQSETYHPTAGIAAQHQHRLSGLYQFVLLHELT